VAVFGGGVAGLTAAHELVERGFDVTVYERRAWGGKARSTRVPGSATGGRKPLPGEHAYRAEFGAYQNVPDTMSRIPFRSNPNGVRDNMVEVPAALFARSKAHNLVLPLEAHDPSALTPQRVIDLILGALIDMEVRPDAAAYLVNRLAVFFSSCDQRRLDQWDKMSWRDFIGGDRFGPSYKTIFERLWEFVQAAKGRDTCARYPAFVLEVWIVQALLGRGTDGRSPLLHLDLPTNEAWIDPWVAHLERLGVRLRLHHELTGLEVRDGQLAGAHLRTPHGRRRVEADWYVCALPVERARKLWSPAILASAPELARMTKLGVSWYSGISYFLRERAQVFDGIVACFDSPWAASFVTQAQFWPVDFARTYGDGSVHDKLSAVVADWDAPGVVYGRSARELTPDQVALDLWEQMKRHVNKPGTAPVLTDAMQHSWQFDPGLLRRHDHWVYEDPLVIPTVGTLQYRPEPKTGIRNLMLCGDYLNGPWEVSNMETACFNGRRAANVVLDAAGSFETPAKTIAPYRPAEWEPLKRIDEDRWRKGQPNLLDLDLTAAQLSTLFGAPGATVGALLP
jgi:uncharacterized protein with NAD-binding domain and iron-sulfur cluster